MPICTSGSSYQEYFLKQDSGEIFSLNPNEDMDIELELEKYKIATSLEEFIDGFEEVIYIVFQNFQQCKKVKKLFQLVSR